MTFPEIVKTTLWDIIDEMSRSLSSFVKNPDKDFIRKRKLDFKKMMHLIISMESGSLNHELLKFFEYDSSVPTGSAFYQQRSKLSVSAFHHLLKEFNLKFPLEKFRGKYYLIACDGSEFNIARLGVLKMSFKLSAILWIGMPMGGPPFSLLTGDFPVTTFLPMQSKIMLIF